MAHLQVVIPEDLNASVSEAVDKGEYASQSDMVIEALRLLVNERALDTANADLITAKWDEAIAANGPYHDPDPILDRLEAKYTAMMEPLG